VFSKKFYQRFLLVFSNAVRQFSAQAVNLVVSMLVVNWYSDALWGNFSTCLLYTSLLSIVTSWGNREYLLREFSKAPSKVSKLFYLVLNARWPLLILAFLITFFVYPIREAGIIILWILGLHITQSMEVLLNFKRNFLSALLVELLAFSMLMLSLYLTEIRNLYQLMYVYACYHLLRSACYILLFRHEIGQPELAFERKYFKNAYIFFILGIIGFLQSRIDFLIFTFFGDAAQIGMYQVISAYYIFIHAVGTLIVFPFVKNIYRMADQTVDALQQKIILAASGLVFLSLLFLYLLNTFVYHFELDASVYLLGIGIIYPPYFYVIKIFQIYKYNQQQQVLKTGVIAICINSIIAIILLIAGKGITAVLIASAVAQIFTAWNYHLYKIKKGTVPLAP
jgi:O-antigen/teichoic acid export membrane protein